jgi:hypothetical protein
MQADDPSSHPRLDRRAQALPAMLEIAAAVHRAGVHAAGRAVLGAPRKAQSSASEDGGVAGAQTAFSDVLTPARDDRVMGPGLVVSATDRAGADAVGLVAEPTPAETGFVIGHGSSAGGHAGTMAAGDIRRIPPA